MLIWGSKGRTKTVGTGQFFCPRCRQNRAYERKNIGKYFTLYFIPVLKTEDLADYVECQFCLTPFEPEVIQHSKQIRADQEVADQIADFVVLAKDALSKGVPLDVLIAELQRGGLEKDAAVKLVVMAAEEKISQCPTCEMVYSGSLSFCSGCGTRLRPVPL